MVWKECTHLSLLMSPNIITPCHVVCCRSVHSRKHGHRRGPWAPCVGRGEKWRWLRRVQRWRSSCLNILTSSCMYGMWLLFCWLGSALVGVWLIAGSNLFHDLSFCLLSVHWLLLVSPPQSIRTNVSTDSTDTRTYVFVLYVIFFIIFYFIKFIDPKKRIMKNSIKLLALTATILTLFVMCRKDADLILDDQ